MAYQLIFLSLSFSMSKESLCQVQEYLMITQNIMKYQIYLYILFKVFEKTLIIGWNYLYPRL